MRFFGIGYIMDVVFNINTPRYPDDSIVKELFTFVYNNDESKVKENIIGNNSSNFYLNKSKRTLLHLAASSDTRVNVLSILLDAGADVTMRDVWGSTPLIVAIIHNAKQCVTVLLSYEQTLKCLLIGDKNGRLPLHFAVTNSDDMLLRVLGRMNPQALTIEDKRKRTVLDLAVLCKQKKIVETCFKLAKKYKISLKTWNATIQACRQSSVEIIKILLEEGKVDFHELYLEVSSCPISSEVSKLLMVADGTGLVAKSVLRESKYMAKFENEDSLYFGLLSGHISQKHVPSLKNIVIWKIRQYLMPLHGNVLRACSRIDKNILPYRLINMLLLQE
ncbi:unnamed protein product [Dimorphilus gyrociliatus]|uniref:Uncharacterized protein n=1 Tax=Dimorphilus gyrociliatus TaxID=2664684 RepID=A0A7I8VEZ0_9ANNE|nr:unnamed protein product [Dimorphilus gyrociliatus]